MQASRQTDRLRVNGQTIGRMDGRMERQPGGPTDQWTAIIQSAGKQAGGRLTFSVSYRLFANQNSY